MGLLVEFYQIPFTGKAIAPREHGLTPDEEILVKELTQKGQITERVGLTALTTRYRTKAAHLTARRDSDFPLMTYEERVRWGKLLPQVYSKNISSRIISPPPGGSWENYDSSIPLAVLELIESLQSSLKFTALEIWTSGAREADQILVGWKDYIGPFLLARWGETLTDFE